MPLSCPELATFKRWCLNKNMEVQRRVVVTLGEGDGGKGKMDKGDQLYGNGWKLNFWW